MTQITTDVAIQRFGENEERVNTFVNEFGSYETNTAPSSSVQTLPSFMQDLQQRYFAYSLKGDWATGVQYIAKDIVLSGGYAYMCIIDHVSATFSTDLAGGKWALYQGISPEELELAQGSPIGAFRVFSENTGIVEKIKSYSYNVGDKVLTNLYGGSLWIIKASVVLQDPFSSTVNFDDELHLVVNLNGGGTGIAECQVSTIAEFAKQKYSEQYTVAFAKLRQSSQGQSVKIACYGDSITFGQYTGQSGAIIRTGEATGFGDGSLYEHDQHPNPWPNVLQTTLREVYGNSAVYVENRGYSGDRSGSGYCRHRVNPDDDFSLIFYGTNDNLYATNNGTAPAGLFTSSAYSISTFIPALRKFAIRQILRGSVPVLVAPSAHASLSGYDGTQYAAAKLLAYFTNAIYALGEELGIPVINVNEIFGNYPLNYVVFDGVHPSTEGHLILGRRLTALFIGRGFKYAEKVSGERRLNASIFFESLDGNSSSEIVAIPNENSFGKPFFNSTEAVDIVIGGNSVAWSFYLEEDSKLVMPIGYLQNGEMNYSIDFDNGGYVYEKLRVDSLGVKGERKIRQQSKTVSSPSAIRDFNHPAQFVEHVVIVGKGWHTIRIAATSGNFIASGIRFFDENTYWNTLALESGFVSFGDCAPAWAVIDGSIKFRGSVVTPNLNARLKMFDFPSGLNLPTLPTTSITLPWTMIKVSMESGALYWDANVGTSVNILNLENISIPLNYLT